MELIQITSGNFSTTKRRAFEHARAPVPQVSYVDSNIGKVLDALDELEFTDNTVVGFIADHGYQLGEWSMWEK